MPGGGRRLLVPVAVLGLVGGLLAYPFGSPAGAARGTLPNGTPIGIAVSGPDEGAVEPPEGFTFGGTTDVGSDAGGAHTALIYALDVSVAAGKATGQGGFDCGSTEKIVTCEGHYGGVLNQQAVLGEGVARVGAVAFAQGAVTADVSPARNFQATATPQGDNGGSVVGPMANAIAGDTFVSEDPIDGGFIEFTREILDGRHNDVGEGIRQAVQVAGFAAQPTTYVALFSTGQVSDPDDVSAALDNVPASVHIFTYAVGAGASCEGVLQQIADRTGGQCLQPNSNHIDGPGSLLDKLTHLRHSELDGVTVSMDGGPAQPASVGRLPIDGQEHLLPFDGPVSAQWSVFFFQPPVGRHSICATATGADTGGSGSVTECRNVIVDAPPTVDPGGPYSGLQGNAIPIAGKASDPDSETLTATWSATALPGVRQGATCTFADPAAFETTVSCDAPGQYTLTLQVSDGLAAPVPKGTTLTIANAPPVVSAGGPYTGTEGLPVALTGVVTDPDSPELGVQWSVTPPPGSPAVPVDPPPSEGPPAEGDPGTGDETGPPPCSFTDPAALQTQITCPTVGDYTLTLTVNDGDNEPVTATAPLTIVPAHVPVGSLSLAGTVAPAVGFVGGDPVLVTYTVRNDGELPMPDVRLAVPLPRALAGAVPAPAAVTPGGASCRAGTICQLGTIEPRQRRTVRFAVRAAAATDATITARVVTSGADANAADNTAATRVVVRAPTLTVDPTSGKPGIVVHVVGTGFPAGARLSLAWSVGLSQPGVFVVGRDGTFSAQMLVFRHQDAGPRDLVATVVSGTRFGPVTANSFLVAPRDGLGPPFGPTSWPP